eukprot:gene21154-biopygen17642
MHHSSGEPAASATVTAPPPSQVGTPGRRAREPENRFSENWEHTV